MASAASHRAHDPLSAQPGPDGGSGLSAPATPATPAVPAATADGGAGGADQRRRHRLQDTGEQPPIPQPVAGPVAARAVPPLPVPAFDVPEVKVHHFADPTGPVPGAQAGASASDEPPRHDPGRTDPLGGSPADTGDSGRSRRTPDNPLFTDGAVPSPAPRPAPGPPRPPGDAAAVVPTQPDPAESPRPHRDVALPSVGDPVPAIPRAEADPPAHRPGPRPGERGQPPRAMPPPLPAPAPQDDNPVRPTQRVFPGRVRPPPGQGSSARLPPVTPRAPGTRPPGPPHPSQPQGGPPGIGARPGPPSRPAPAPVPTRDSGLDGRLGDRAPHGDGLARRVARFAAHLVTTTRATRELAELAEAAQAPVTTGRRIAVVSVCGGAGRSTVTALLGSVFAARRADHVLVADADAEHGSLAWRLGVVERDALAALRPRLLAARGLADLDALPRTASGLRLLPGPAGAPPGASREVTRALSRFFAVCVTDCGRGLQLPAATEVLQDAHAAVVVAPATPDGVRSTLSGLAQVPPALLQRTVIALNTTGRGGRAALHVAAAHEVLTRTGAALVTIPYDRHLAAATPVEPGRLAESTAIEATRLAGLALHRAGQPPWAPGLR